MSKPRESERGDALLSRYAQDTSFFFASPQGAQLAARPGQAVVLAAGDDVSGVVMRALSRAGRATAERAVVAGALPFDSGQPARLRLHAAPAESAPLSIERTARDSDVYAIPSLRRVVMEPPPAGYLRAVSAAVERIRAGALRKVVLARALDIELRRSLDLTVLLRRLAEQNPNKYVFSCDVSDGAGPRRMLLGASPELLVQKQGQSVISHPLAGSLPRSLESSEDRARAERLTRSAKNLVEHACVVEAVADTLSPLCSELHVPEAPTLVQTAAMWHLGSKVVGKLRSCETSSIMLARALHPTPAVCGQPRAAAAAAIAELESFDRSYFAGTVGYCDGNGDGEWAVTIRCAEVQGATLRLYAGAGIVADSVAQDELEETTAKLNTMLQALGIDLLRQAL